MVLEEAFEQSPGQPPASRVQVVGSRSQSGRSGGGPQPREADVSTVVVEVSSGSNAEKAGVRVGDKIRFFTAVFTVSDPVDIMSYYANPPKKENRRGVFVADNQPFDRTMAALASNSQPHVTAREGVTEVAESVLMVVERSED